MKILTCLIALCCGISQLWGQSNDNAIFSTAEIILETSTGNIYGTLTIPRHIFNSPLVIIIADSGPIDRDCNSPLGIQTNAYKMLAESLAKNGIATLRFDKRGVGKSKSAVKSEIELKFETYVNDVIAWVSFLKPDPRISKVILLGHGEGSLIGMIAADQAKTAAFISIAGFGRPADKILQEQLKNLTPAMLNESNNILDSLKAGKTVSDVNPNLFGYYRPSIQPYLISWMKYDPVKVISKLKLPVLIIQGDADLQVTAEDVIMLSKSKPNATLLFLNDMNHVLKVSEADKQKNLATYTNPALPLKSGLVDVIVSFVKPKK
jgi:pimeloyl-ACP methyl ester carboxylesterase